MQRQDGGRANGGGPYGGGGQDATYVIPADKCGLVIGKGGETIREINSRSGARAELSRNENPSSAQRTFNIKGSPEQIQEAIRLICEKAGLVSCCLFLCVLFKCSVLLEFNALRSDRPYLLILSKPNSTITCGLTLIFCYNRCYNHYMRCSSLSYSAMSEISVFVKSADSL